MSVFRVTASDGEARAGVLSTAHGEIETPVFMPVGTKATVKTLMPDEVSSLGARILLANTYHLHFRPGDELIAELGGLHRFMGWSGPILTDSGGFQVFSLRETLSAVDDDGVTFRNVYDGAATRFTPELAAEIQRNLGERHRDVPRPGAAPRRRARRARGRGPPHDRMGEAPAPRCRAPRGSFASRSSRAASTGSSAPLGRGARSSSTSTATRSAASRSARTASRCSTTTDWLAPQLPAAKPRYFMGIGDPEGILEVIEAGVDMFDCVLPTRTARTGSALTWEGRLNLRNARFARDPAPARRELRLPGLRDVLPRLHPPPREPGRAARPPPALAPQSTLRPGADPPRPRGDRAGRLPPLQARRARASRTRTWAPVIVIAILLGLGWLALAVPWRRRQRSHAAMQDDVVVGDEIITAGGMHAVVREAGERELRIEIAPGVVVTLDRRAVAAVAQDVNFLTKRTSP